MWGSYCLMWYFPCDDVIALLCLCVPVSVLLLPFLDLQLPNWSLKLLQVSLAKLHRHLPSSACGRFLEGMLLFPTSMSSWAEYWCILGGTVAECQRCAAQEESWNPMSMIQLADPVSQAFSSCGLFNYLFISYFLSHPTLFPAQDMRWQQVISLSQLPRTL